ncbi:tail fiber assembly protein [Pseudomonas aeruginosa]|uniref:tail fiber assembly protein n=1 Tax=Pseudomonas aeruginosa TaxID=287 RepID=UPI00374A51DF
MIEQELVQPGPEQIKSMQWAAVRARRDQLLRATDFTQTADSPLSEAQRAEVAIYRQALRDVPEDGQDPFSVVWPERPAYLK